MEFDIKELFSVCYEGCKADVRIDDKQAVYQFDGEKWILMEVWKLVEVDPLDPNYIIKPDGPPDEPFHKHYLTGTGS
jgi:hypothetical protein